MPTKPKPKVSPSLVADPFAPEGARIKPAKGKNTFAATEAAQRRDRFVMEYSQCGNVEVTCARLNMSRSTYHMWRNRDPHFAAKIDSLKTSHGANTHAGWEGGFASFRKVFFGHDSPAVHMRMAQIFDTALPGSVNMVLIAPEHGKTTFTEDYDGYKLATDPDFRITVGSEGQPHARKILSRVKRRMTDPRVAPDYLNRFGPFYVAGMEREGKSWGADYFTVAKASHDERDYSMEARGMRSSIAGTRTDLLQVDDAQSRKSLNLTDSLVEVFRQDWLSRPGQDGRTIIVGTRVGDWDFYEALQHEGIVDNLVCFPAILPDGSPLWPEKWPMEKLQKQRVSVGETAWWRNYMQAPRNAASATFPAEALEACHNPLKTVMVADPQTEHWSGTRVMTLDPALGGGNSVTVAELSAERMTLRCSRADYGLSRFEQILEILDDTAYRYRPSLLVVESNAYQRQIAGDDRLVAMASRYGFRIQPHQTQDNKHDPDFGVAAMATDFITRRIDLPWADEASQAQVGALEAELMAWRPFVKGTRLRMDRVMSLWFAWLQWRKMASVGGSTDPRSFRRAGLPWTPTNALVRRSA